jgi:hypothetical protein
MHVPQKTQWPSLGHPFMSFLGLRPSHEEFREHRSNMAPSVSRLIPSTFLVMNLFLVRPLK